jgi:bifunctional UDP-N-acetylglucosamine pyrophosphorylase/glucosamine-1-phosphate N-acetyltransferase
VLSAGVLDPSGLGRIIRGPGGEFQRIVEERDATEAERRITEINSGVAAFDAVALRRCLLALAPHNAQREEYLTDVYGLLVGEGAKVAVHQAGSQFEVLGCNDRVQLADLARFLRTRINRRLMCEGVTIKDPATTWIDVTVRVEPDAVIEPNVQLRGNTVIENGALVGPDTTLTDVHVGPGASVIRTHGNGARIGAGASVGPYAALRPGTELGADGKIGTFVETKNAQIGTGSKVPHLSYVGDATIGEHTNIGAATVFVNYDGVNKSRTVIGSHARTGSDNMFVAPVEVGDGAYTGAGTVVRRNVPAGALSYSHAPQKIVEGWVAARRAGTAAAEAANAAQHKDSDENGAISPGDEGTDAGTED